MLKASGALFGSMFIRPCAVHSQLHLHPLFVLVQPGPPHQQQQQCLLSSRPRLTMETAREGAGGVGDRLEDGKAALARAGNYSKSKAW